MKKNKIFLLILFSLTSLFQNTQPMAAVLEAIAFAAQEACLVIVEYDLDSTINRAIENASTFFLLTENLASKNNPNKYTAEKAVANQKPSDQKNFKSISLDPSIIPQEGALNLSNFNPNTIDFIDALKNNYINNLVGCLEVGIAIPEEALAVINTDKLAVVHVDTHGQVKSIEAKSIDIPAETIKTLEKVKVSYQDFTEELLQIHQKRLDRIAYEQKTQLNYQRVKTFQDQALFEITKRKVSPEYAIRRELAAREEAIRELAESLRCPETLKRDFLYANLGFFDKVFLVYQAPHLLQQHSGIRKRLISNPAILASEYLFAVTENWPERTIFHEKINAVARQRKQTLRTSINSVANSTFQLNDINSTEIDRLKGLAALNSLCLPETIGDYALYHKALADLRDVVQRVISQSPSILDSQQNIHIIQSTAQFLSRTITDPLLAETTFNNLLRNDAGLIAYAQRCPESKEVLDFYYAKRGPQRHSWLTFWRNDRAVPKEIGPYFTDAHIENITNVVRLIGEGLLEEAHNLVATHNKNCCYSHQKHYEVLKRLKDALISEIPIETSSCISEIEQTLIPCGTADHFPEELDIPLCEAPEDLVVDTGECLKELDSIPDIDLCGTDAQTTLPEDIGQCNFSKGSQNLPSLDDSTQIEDPSQVQDENPPASGSVDGTLTDVVESIEEILSEPATPAIEGEIIVGEDIIDIGLTAEAKAEAIEKILKDAELEIADYLERIKELKDNSAIAEQYKAKPIEAYQMHIKSIEDSAIAQAIEIQNRPEIISKTEEVKYILPHADKNKALEIALEVNDSESMKELYAAHDIATIGKELSAINDLPGYCTELENGQYARTCCPSEIRNDLDMAENWAKQEYEKFKIDAQDIEQIAINTKLPVETISEIKQHLFFEKYYLDVGHKTLDPNHEQAEAWIRLRDGDYIKNDIKWLMHEYVESKVLQEAANKVLRIAHNAVERIEIKWAPPEYKDK